MTDQQMCPEAEKKLEAYAKKQGWPPVELGGVKELLMGIVEGVCGEVDFP